MINDLMPFLSYENIYFIANSGVIPFWLLLITLPNHNFTNFFVQSIVVTLLLASAYCFVAYSIFLDNNILDSFELYSGLDGLYTLFANEAFLLIFWLHFLSLSLFTGSWIARDSYKYLMPKFLVIISLIITYFTGPVGLFFYWIVRIFYAKKISFND